MKSVNGVPAFAGAHLSHPTNPSVFTAGWTSDGQRTRAHRFNRVLIQPDVISELFLKWHESARAGLALRPASRDEVGERVAVW